MNKRGCKCLGIKMNFHAYDRKEMARNILENITRYFPEMKNAFQKLEQQYMKEHDENE